MKLWKNLRASRATELAGVFPGHVASAFLGHSEWAAQKHYWQVTDEDFKKQAQKRAQQTRARGRIGLQDPTDRRQQAPAQPADAPLGHLLQGHRVGDEGLEPPTSTV